jgi:hypothetical protein
LSNKVGLQTLNDSQRGCRPLIKASISSINITSEAANLL